MANEKLPEGSAPCRPPSIGRQLSFAAGAVTTLCNRLLAAHDLSLPQWVVLAALWQRNGLTVSEIADYSGNAIPATSRILDRMLAKGLVQRTPDAEDRRAVRISLDARGEDLRHLSQFHATVNERLLAGIAPDDAALLSRLLDQITDTAARDP